MNLLGCRLLGAYVAKDNSDTHRIRANIFLDTTFVDGAGSRSLFGKGYTAGNPRISNRYEFATIYSDPDDILAGTLAGANEAFYLELDCVEEAGDSRVDWVGEDLQISKIVYRYEE